MRKRALSNIKCCRTSVDEDTVYSYFNELQNTFEKLGNYCYLFLFGMAVQTFSISQRKMWCGSATGECLSPMAIRISDDLYQGWYRYHNKVLFTTATSLDGLTQVRSKFDFLNFLWKKVKPNPEKYNLFGDNWAFHFNVVKPSKKIMFIFVSVIIEDCIYRLPTNLEVLHTHTHIHTEIYI